ncbi:hypothetical protein C3L33_13071, partial [Rhododendron williamsianum]
MAASSTCTRNPILVRPNLLIPPHNTNNILKMKNNTPPMISHPLKMIPRCSSVAGGDVFSVSSSSKHDVDYLGIDGQASLDGPIEEVARMEAQEAEDLLNDLGISSPFSSRNSPHGIICSRTLNFRSISAIGYDMDYTLMHYNVMAWEGRAYDYCMDNLKSMGFPLVIRGLVIDKEKGNLVKADRFGYVQRAMHGTRMLSNRAVSEMYGRELVDLRKENRWEFLNTLFSVSEAVAYMQSWLVSAVGKALFRAHVEGQLKNEIMSKPELFVEPDPELPLALLDQKEVIVSARKPEFFQMSHPMYEVVTGEGLMRPCFKAHPGGLYSGGSAQMVENSLNLHGDEILYVGDHIYTDVMDLVLVFVDVQIVFKMEKSVATISIVQIYKYNALIRGRGHRATLVELINQKEVVGDLFNQLRLALQRRTKGRPAQTLAATNMDDQELTESIQRLLIVMQRLDQKIAPLLEADGEHFNRRLVKLNFAELNTWLPGSKCAKPT